MIRAVVFDLGGVLYNYNHNILIETIAKELGVSFEEVLKKWKKPIIEYEVNNINEDKFWQILLEELGLNYKHNNLHDIVINHFQPIEENLKLVEKLKGNFFLGMITNHTSWLEDLENKYNFRKKFNLVLESHEVKMRKPNSNIFEQFIRKSRFLPNEIVFIDDTKEYKEAVEKLGINFIHYKNSLQLISDLKRMKVISN